MQIHGCHVAYIAPDTTLIILIENTNNSDHEKNKFTEDMMQMMEMKLLKDTST